MKYFKAVYPLILALSVWSITVTSAAADIICEGTRTSFDEFGNQQSQTLNVYVKSNKIKMEWTDDLSSFIIRSDLQAILSIDPAEAAYHTIDFSQLYTIPFGPSPLTIAPGFGEPIVEFIDTGETELLNGLSCSKYVITEIASFRLVQYTIYATNELDFTESFSAYFSTDAPLRYQPFEEMKKIPGLPLKISISETVGNSTFVQTYEFSNYQETSLNESIFDVPEGYTLK